MPAVQWSLKRPCVLRTAAADQSWDELIKKSTSYSSYTVAVTGTSSISKPPITSSNFLPVPNGPLSMTQPASCPTNCRLTDCHSRTVRLSLFKNGPHRSFLATDRLHYVCTRSGKEKGNNIRELLMTCLFQIDLYNF